MNKKLKNESNKIYRTLRLKSDSAFTYDYILDRYNVDSELLKKYKKEGLKIGFNTSYIERLISEFINSGWEIVAVSEDDKSMCYHMVTEYEE